MTRRITWTPDDGERLRAARKRAGHRQEDCATYLAGLGLEGTSQTAVSDWETGRTEHLSDATVAILKQYISDFPPAAGEPPSVGGVHGGTGELAVDDDEAFGDLVRGETGEPLLGPLQRELVVAMCRRLASGPPLSEADEVARSWLAGVLQVPRYRR